MVQGTIWIARKDAQHMPRRTKHIRNWCLFVCFNFIYLLKAEGWKEIAGIWRDEDGKISREKKGICSMFVISLMTHGIGPGKVSCHSPNCHNYTWVYAVRKIFNNRRYYFDFIAINTQQYYTLLHQRKTVKLYFFISLHNHRGTHSKETVRFHYFSKLSRKWKFMVESLWVPCFKLYVKLL